MKMKKKSFVPALFSNFVVIDFETKFLEGMKNLNIVFYP